MDALDRQQQTHMKIAFVYNWPGAKNAEFELIGRMRAVLSGLGHTTLIIDPYGHVLDDDGAPMAVIETVEGSQADFCLNLHYSSPNLLDCFSYMANWNPDRYIVRDPVTDGPISPEHLSYLKSCLASHDIAISAHSESTDRLVSTLTGRPDNGKTFPDLRLCTTCAAQPDIQPVRLRDFRVFYIGINWEKIGAKGRKRKRHCGLLELLDQTGRVDFYGLRKMGKIRLWQGFENYRGELPFDNGRSIVEAANNCGVSLVLSSPQHRAAAVVSSRFFEACAARTVIISDDNPFVVREFGDTVLTFPYADDPQLNCRRIVDLIVWVEEHPQEAIAKAESAHRIFLKRFVLNRQLAHLVKHHQTYRRSVEAQFLPVDSGQTVDVFYECTDFRNETVAEFVANLNRQKGVQVHAVIACACEDALPLTAYLDEHAQFAYTPLPATDDNETAGSRLLKAVRVTFKGDAFCLYAESVTWFGFHLAWLLRSLEDGEGAVSQTFGIVRNRFTAQHYYVDSLASITLRTQLSSLSADRLCRLPIRETFPSAFLFRRSLMDESRTKSSEISLFHESLHLFLLFLHFANRDDPLPSAGRVSFTRNREDMSFDMFDPESDPTGSAMRNEMPRLWELFRQEPAIRRLDAASSSAQTDEKRKGYSERLYFFILSNFENRRAMRWIAFRVYYFAHFLMRTQPYPPKWR